MGVMRHPRLSLAELLVLLAIFGIVAVILETNLGFLQ